MKTGYALTVILACSVLAACGGGGGTGSTSSNTQVTVTTLAGSGGDMSKYLGVWKSDCGFNLTGANQGKYQTNVFNFTSSSGGTATGTLTVQLYTDPSCASNFASGTGLPVSVTATYQSNLAVTSGTPPTMAGSADQLGLLQAGSGTSQSFTVGFYANFSKFYQGTGSFFNTAALSYSKL